MSNNKKKYGLKAIVLIMALASYWAEGFERSLIS